MFGLQSFKKIAKKISKTTIKLILTQFAVDCYVSYIKLYLF